MVSLFLREQALGLEALAIYQDLTLEVMEEVLLGLLAAAAVLAGNLQVVQVMEAWEGQAVLLQLVEHRD